MLHIFVHALPGYPATWGCGDCEVTAVHAPRAGAREAEPPDREAFKSLPRRKRRGGRGRVRLLHLPVPKRERAGPDAPGADHRAEHAADPARRVSRVANGYEFPLLFASKKQWN